MTIILNEKKYAKRCLEDKTLGENAWQTAQIIAKYYYFILGYRKKRIETELTAFVSQNYGLYKSNVQRWQESIEKIAASAGKYPLFEHNSVPITKEEFAKITDCGLSKQHQQVLFTYLCLAKLGNIRNEKNNGWVNHKTKDVFSLAHVSLSEEKQDYMINDFYTRGLVDLPKKNDNLAVRITFCDMEGEIHLAVSDFRDLGYYYLKEIGENIVACAECGVLMRGNKAGTKKYCNDCAGYIPQTDKLIQCIDCGKEFKIAGNNTRTKRCADCQSIINREKRKIWKQKHDAECKVEIKIKS